MTSQPPISAFAPGAEVAERLPEWCHHHLGSVPTRELFRTGYLSRVIGLELEDGRQMVVKVRSFAPRLVGCAEVQRHLFGEGFPCPQPLVGPVEIEGLAWSAEVLVPGGAPLPGGPGVAARYAGLLARLIALAPPPSAVSSLAPNPAWVGWDHVGDEVWPLPDDLRADLNDHAGPGWLDDLAGDVRRRLQALSLDPVLGHGDWYSLNIDWHEEKPLAVHDWDSVICQPEAAIAGTAAAVFPAGEGVMGASITESEAFLESYQEERGRAFAPEEVQAAWAAGLWTSAFDSKKDLVKGHGSARADALASELTERSRRAGI